MNIAAEFKIPYVQILNEQSELVDTLPDFAQNIESLVALHKEMHLLRALDARAVTMQRTGKMGTYPSALGQEAVSTGLGSAMSDTDVLVPYYRDQGSMLHRGITPTEILRYWSGDERGSNFSHQKEDFPLCIPIATQLLHAAGIGYAFKLKNEKRAVVSGCGDGGTSEGDFYEAINFIGAQNLPVVFVINNNQWAISVPRAAQTHCQTLAQKAIAGGVEGIQVDGNDIIAIRHVMNQALEKARNGNGPTLIEAVTYRLCDHTTADDASRYVSKIDLDKAWSCEPIQRLNNYLQKQGVWDDEKEDQLKKTCAAKILEAAQACLSTSPPQTTDIIDYLYETLPEAYKDQREQIANTPLSQGH